MSATVESSRAFVARAEAKAMLVDLNMMGLLEAVDELQEAAERDGLIARLGQDAVQSMISQAFRARS